MFQGKRLKTKNKPAKAAIKTVRTSLKRADPKNKKGKTEKQSQLSV